MSGFADDLAARCRAHPTRAKWVFVPSHAIGRTIGDRLTLAGTEWANLRFVTPFEIAIRMGAPFLVERGVDPSEEGLGPALVMRLLMSLPDEGGGGYFRPLADQPQMALALWTTMRELRMAGIGAADLRAAAFESADKHAELVALMSSYERYLGDNRRGDRATVFAEALQHLDWCPIQTADCWTTLPDVRWAPLEERLFDVMPGDRVALSGWSGGLKPSGYESGGRGYESGTADTIVVAGRGQPAGCESGTAADTTVVAGRGQPAECESGTAADTTVVAGGLQPAGRTDAGAAARPSAVHFFHAGGAEAEIEEIFRRVLAGGASLDHVEIVCPNPRTAALVWEKAVRYEWPVTLAHGLPVAVTRPGRALLSLIDWIDDDFAAGRLRRLLESGDVRFDALTMSPARAARMLVKAQAAWGRQTFRLALSRYAASSRRRADRDDLPKDQSERLKKDADEAEALAQWIDALVASVPAADANGRVALRDVAECARAFIDACGSRVSALDRVAAAALVDAIGELRALDDFRCPLDHALRFITERVDALTVGADRPRPGHLHVSTLATAGYAGRPIVFVMGLEEGRVFPAPFEDPVLLDDERARIGADLRRSHDRTDDVVAIGRARLADIASQAGVSVTCSYSCRDLREYRQTYASWLMLDAFRQATGNPAATYQDLHRYLGEPVSCVPEEGSGGLKAAGYSSSVTAAVVAGGLQPPGSPLPTLDASRWWLRGVVSAGPAARSAVLAAYPSLAAGIAAEEARATAAFTKYDGCVPAAGPVLDPCGAGVVVSPTQLEDAAKCPFRHFLRRGLGVNAIESGERDRDVWIDPLLRGTLLHDLYAALLRRCRGENRRAAVRKDGAWLEACGRNALAELAIEMPPPSEEIRERETTQLLRDLALFLEAEAAQDDGRTPVGFEVGFGRGGVHPLEPLSQEEPVQLDLGAGLKIRVAGRIDRIDQIGPASFEIVDYKTGGYWADDWKGTFAGGSRLQHALYGLAATELLRRTHAKATVSGAQYYFPCEKGQQERKRIPAQPAARVGAVLTDLRQVIVGGLFVHAADEKACKWCDYGHACGANAADRAAAKRSDAALAPVERLAAHE